MKYTVALLLVVAFAAFAQCSTETEDKKAEELSEKISAMIEAGKAKLKEYREKYSEDWEQVKGKAEEISRAITEKLDQGMEKFDEQKKNAVSWLKEWYEKTKGRFGGGETRVKRALKRLKRRTNTCRQRDQTCGDGISPCCGVHLWCSAPTGLVGRGTCSSVFG